MNNARFIRQLTKWRESIVGLSTLTRDGAKDAARALRADTAQNALRERDPYGRKWKRRKHAHPHPILRKTGYMQSRLRVRVRGRDDISATNDTRYAIFHQKGTRLLPIRLVLPSARGGLPESWRRILVKALERRWKQNFAKHGVRTR